MTAQALYNQFLDGDISKETFLYEVRRNNTPYITKQNSFEDTVNILKNKSVIFEDKYREDKNIVNPKQEIKTIDQVSPYEYAKGLDYELDLMDKSVGQNTPTWDEIQKAQTKVLTNLAKDDYFYTRKIMSDTEKKQEKANLRPEELGKKMTAPNQMDKGKVLKEGWGFGDRFWVNKINNHNFEILDKENIINFLKNNYSDDLNNEEMEYYADNYAKLNELPPYDSDEFHFQNMDEGVDKDREYKNKLSNFLDNPDGDGFGIYGYTNVIHDIMTDQDDEYTPEDIDDYLEEEGIIGYGKRIKGIYDDYFDEEDIDEAIAVKDAAGNIQYAKDDNEANTIMNSAKQKGVQLTKSNV